MMNLFNNYELSDEEEEKLNEELRREFGEGYDQDEEKPEESTEAGADEEKASDDQHTEP